MASILFPSPYPPTAVTAPPQAIYSRVLWSASWVTAGTYLWCNRLALATGETISTADFRWRFGAHLPPGGTAWEAVPLLGVNPRGFVRVDVAGTAGRPGFTWYGVWQRAEKTDQMQTLNAVGVEQLLDVPCLDMPFWDSQNSAVCWAKRGLGFNEGGPNRGPVQTVNGQSVHVFSDDPLCTDYWTTRDAVATLLAAAAPIDAAEAVIFNWVPTNTGALPNFDKPQLPTHGRTFLELLRSLVPRYRLIGWTVEPSESDVAVRFFTFAETAVNLVDADGAAIGTIPANNTQDALLFSYDQSSHGSLVTEASHVADQVIVRGDRRQIVCTLSTQDGTLESKWDTAAETAYIDGASGAADYPAADEIRLREERDRDARNVEDLRSVFAWFGPPAEWDQQTADGEGVETLQPIAVDEEDAQFRLHTPSLAILQNVPREIDTDRYDEDLPLLSFVRACKSTADPASKDRWCTGDQLARAADLEQLDDGTCRRWSLAVRPLAEVIASALWLECRVNGAEQHALGAWAFATRDDRVVGAIAYQVDLILTIALEDTRDLEARYPADEDLEPLGQLLNRLHLTAPGYRYVDVRPNTVIAVNADDSQLVRSAGEIVVDDTDELLLIAQRTHAWHATPRYALGFGTGWIDATLQIGHLITQITDSSGVYPVRSVITEITLEFPISDSTTPQRPSLSIATAFAEMDAAKVV